MSILCTTSQLNLGVLNLVQSLAKGSSRSPQKTKAATIKLKTTLETSPPLSSPKDKLKAMKLQPSMPAHMEMGGASGKIPMSTSKVQGSTSRTMPTLNMLGMQPDFSIPDGESVYTVTDETIVSQSVVRERADDGGNSIDEYDYIKHMDFSDPIPIHRQETLTPGTIGTQSLIENESIPDPLPSTMTSNVTVLDAMESIITVDFGESLGKSAGHLLTSSNLKDFSVSNLLSPSLLPSGELKSIEELVDSIADTTNGELKESNDTGMDALTENASNHSKSSPDLGGVWTKKGSSVDLYQLRSTDEPWQVVIQDDNGQEVTLQPIKPQQVKIVSVPESEQRSVETRCTHYTHSTAPLAGGANILGSQVHPSTIIRHSALYSTASSKSPTAAVTNESAAALSISKFASWPSEVAIAYIMGMTSCAIYGRTSLIQRTAMEGFVQEVGVVTDERGVESSKGHKCGLLDMAEFHAEEEGMEISNVCLIISSFITIP